MNVLVTGSNGFVGRTLVEYLKCNKYAVFGIDVQSVSNSDHLVYKKIDILEYERIFNFLEKNGIVRVYHLAALANPREAALKPFEAVQTNTGGALVFFEAARKYHNLRVLCVGSSEQYCVRSGEKHRLLEDDNTCAKNIYGASKIAAEIIGRQYAEQFNARIYFTRSFNHSGPGQSPVYLLSSLGKQFAAMKMGLADHRLSVGNIDISRDFLDVRDVAAAYEAILEQGRAGTIYNVSSGRTITIRDVIKLFIRLAEIENIEIVQDTSLVRANEPAEILGENRRILNDTKWKPKIVLERTISDILNYWMDQYVST